MTVHSVHLADISESLGKDLAWNPDTKVVMVLLGLLAATVHQGSTIWDQSIDHATNLSGHRVCALISATNHHLVDDNFLSSEDDAVLADNATDSADRYRKVKS